MTRIPDNGVTLDWGIERIEVFQGKLARCLPVVITPKKVDGDGGVRIVPEQVVVQSLRNDRGKREFRTRDIVLDLRFRVVGAFALM